MSYAMNAYTVSLVNREFNIQFQLIALIYNYCVWLNNNFLFAQHLHYARLLGELQVVSVVVAVVAKVAIVWYGLLVAINQLLTCEFCVFPGTYYNIQYIC